MKSEAIDHNEQDIEKLKIKDALLYYENFRISQNYKFVPWDHVPKKSKGNKSCSELQRSKTKPKTGIEKYEK